jgi:hypothetical protein
VLALILAKILSKETIQVDTKERMNNLSFGWF